MQKSSPSEKWQLTPHDEIRLLLDDDSNVLFIKGR